jgi:hypothetical protein
VGGRYATEIALGGLVSPGQRVTLTLTDTLNTSAFAAEFAVP